MARTPLARGRRSQRALDAPSLLTNAGIECPLRDTETPSPNSERQHLAQKLNAVDLARIAVLLCPRRPSHIARFVMSVVVDAIERVIRRWAWPHIREEGVETATPAVAHGYAATTIVRERLHSWVMTAAAHVNPDLIFRRATHAPFLALLLHGGIIQRRYGA